MMRTESLGELAVLEQVRRIAVNDPLGGYDAHLQNFGVIYEDGARPTLSPAHDVVAYAAISGRAHGLAIASGGEKRQRLTPANLRAFTREVGLPQPIIDAAIRELVNVPARARRK